jgi:hypothetical protein
MHIQRGEYSTAKQVYDDIIAQYPGTSDDRHAQFQKFLLAFHIDKDRDGAALILNDFTSKYSEGQDVEFAKYLLYNTTSSSEKSASDGQSPTSKKSTKKGIPDKFELSANYPNPFNPSTTIGFDLPEAAKVRLAVYDMLGREVALLADEERPAGQHSVRFDAGRLSSGMYIYRLQAGSFTQTKKLMLLK